MKKIIILSSLIAALGFTGCDVERLPYDSYTDEKINESGEAAVDILLNGCYGRLKSWSEWMHYTGEFGADNMMKQATSSGASFRFISYQHTTTNYGVGYFWNYAYKVIAQSSSIVDLIEEGKIDTTPLITHRFPLNEIEEAYRIFENKLDGVMKVAVSEREE